MEIGSGTGRVAVPLAAAGTPVTGVDASAEMTQVLAERAAKDGLPIEAVQADAGAFTVEEPVPLVFAVFNTYFLLASLDTQHSFLQRSAEALQPAGALVVETFVPHHGRLPDGPHPGVFPPESTVAVKRHDTDRLVLFAATNDPVGQRFEFHEVVFTDGQLPRMYPGSMRYCWPEDIDVLAADAGLRLLHRWEDWDRRPYGPRTSRKHVSVYERV